MNFILGVIVGLILVCGGASWLDARIAPETYQNAKPELKPAEFFDGNLQSWGVVKLFGGPAEERFTAKQRASWYDDKGSMHETFTFPDGTKKERQWTFTMVDDRHIIGTAPDVIGQANGIASGNTMHWVYTILVPVHGHDVALKFDDWLYLIDETHLISRVAISKFGIPLGELTMAFEKSSLK